MRDAEEDKPPPKGMSEESAIVRSREEVAGRSLKNLTIGASTYFTQVGMESSSGEGGGERGTVTANFVREIEIG